MNAAALFRDVGLLPTVPSSGVGRSRRRGPGVFVVELAVPAATAPIELTRVGKWIERVPTLTLDGERPTSKALAARLSAFWLPSQACSTSGRRLSIGATGRGDCSGRSSATAGHISADTGSTPSRVADDASGWAPTDATEEYEDALLAAFAEGVPAAELAALPDRDGRTALREPAPTDRRAQATGPRRVLLPEVASRQRRPTRIVDVPDGDAEGARGEAPADGRRPGASNPVGRSRSSASWSRTVSRRPRRSLSAEGLGAAPGRARPSSIGCGGPRSSPRIATAQASTATSRRTPITTPRARSRPSSRAASRRSRRGCGSRWSRAPTSVGAGRARVARHRRGRRRDGDVHVVGVAEADPRAGRISSVVTGRAGR